jgi:hypothetical protein
MGRSKQYQSAAEKQAAYRNRKLKSNTEKPKRNTDDKIDKLYFAAIFAIRELYKICDGSRHEQIVADSRLSLISRAAFDARANSVFRGRLSNGLKNSDSPLDPEFDKQWQYERKS